MRNQEVLVSAAEITRRYDSGGGPVIALAPATCEIHGAQHIAVMGSSGSGKSTLLHILAGLEEPTTGQIQWPALGSRSELRPGKISIAFQSQNLVPFLNVIENVSLPLLLLGLVPNADSFARDALARLDLAGFEERMPDELSGGQRQRAALARAIVSRPKLLVADEPTAQLDQISAQQTILTLTSWASANDCALIVATHDVAVARSFDEIWRMDHGRLIASVGPIR